MANKCGHLLIWILLFDWLVETIGGTQKTNKQTIILLTDNICPRVPETHTHTHTKGQINTPISRDDTPGDEIRH